MRLMCFVFVLLFSGVTAAGQTTVSNMPDKVLDFGRQLNEITLDFRNDFKNVIGEQLEQEEGSVDVIYSSRVPLEGAEELNFFITGDDFPVLNALFPGSPDPAVALKVCVEMVGNIESLTLTCCGLSKNAEQIDENIFYQTFWTSDANGTMDAAYQNMVIMVKLTQSEVFEDDKFVDVWHPMLVIYKR